MTPERWERVREVFRAVLDQDRGADELLAKLPLADRNQVDEMLRAHEDLSSRFLDPPLKLREADIALQPGALFDDFEIQRQLGSGGMGIVYLAHQRSLDRAVAVKVLRTSIDGLARERLIEEARLASKVRHEGIVRILSVGEMEGTAYFVMEYVEGETLADHLKRARGGLKINSSPEALDPAASCRIIRDLAEALDSVHRAGLTHRDVKPGNVILDETGRPHLVDFGIARELGRETITKETIGTPHYMSPEQARIRPDRIDPRSDVFSLGVILYELLTLERPFRGESLPEVLSSIRDDDPIPVVRHAPSIPRDLATICEKALRKDPGRRYSSAQEIGTDLDRFLTYQAPIHATPPGLIERFERWVRRHPLVVAVSVALILCVPITTTILSAMRDRSELRRDLEDIPSEAAWASLPIPSPESAPEWVGMVRRTHSSIRRIEERHQLTHEVEGTILRARERAIGGAKQLMEVAIDSMRRRGASQPVGSLLDQLRPFLPQNDRSVIDEEMAALASRVSVSSVPQGATVTAWPLDPVTGQHQGNPVELGTTPIRGAPVRAGVYRLDLVATGALRGEVLTMISRPGEIHFLPEVHLRHFSELQVGMVRIEPSLLRLPLPRKNAIPNPLYPRGDQELAEFWVDRHEASIGDYLAFCHATDRPRPSGWPEEIDSRWRGLPAVWVDVYDAEAYAAWKGKRLLHSLEWERLTRPIDGATNPWNLPGSDEEVIRSRARVWISDARSPTRPTWDDFTRHARAVTEGEASLDGILNLLGNASEWTASFASVQVADEQWGFEAGTRWVRGMSWKSLPRKIRQPVFITAQSTDMMRGFRCACTKIE